MTVSIQDIGINKTYPLLGIFRYPPGETGSEKTVFVGDPEEGQVVLDDKAILNATTIHAFVWSALFIIVFFVVIFA